MSIKLFPDFEHAFKVGDRLIYEVTIQQINGRLAMIPTNVIFSPAGAKGGRSVIFVDEDEPVYLEDHAKEI
jgi:hypothetical protein